MIVTVDEIKAHLRIEHDEEDAYIESLIAWLFHAILYSALKPHCYLFL